MRRTTIFLSEDVHRGLRYLALDHHVSMAELLRAAVERVYREDLEDIRSAKAARNAHRRAPGNAMEAHEYFKKHKHA